MLQCTVEPQIISWETHFNSIQFEEPVYIISQKSKQSDRNVMSKYLSLNFKQNVHDMSGSYTKMLI